MTPKRRLTIILVLVIAALFMAPYSGVLWAAKWQSTASNESIRATGDPNNYAPLFAPTGNWQVYVDGPDAVRKPLMRQLEQALTRVTVGQTKIDFVTDVPAISTPVNTLVIILETKSTWLPVYGKFADKATIKIRTISGQVPPDEIAIVPGSTHMDGTYAVAGVGSGLVGRPQMNAYRAQMVSEFVTKMIDDTFSDLRQRSK